MKLLLKLAEEEMKIIEHIAEKQNREKEEIAQTMIEIMVVWLKDKAHHYSDDSFTLD